MEFLKKILRIAVSTFIPFVFLAKLGNTYIPHDDHHLSNLTEFTLYDIKATLSYCAPLFYVIAFLVQGLLVIPLWDLAVKKAIATRITFFIILCIVVVGIAIGLSYAVWDTAAGTDSLNRSIKTLVIVQVLYWVFNLLALFILDMLLKRKPKAADKV